MIEQDDFDAQARALVPVLNASEAKSGTGALWRFVPACGTVPAYLRRSPTRIRLPKTCDRHFSCNEDDEDEDEETEEDPSVARQTVQDEQGHDECNALCEWHVLWSSAFRVPVMHYSLASADGTALDFAAEVAYADALAAAHGGPTSEGTSEGTSPNAFITSGEHPALGVPFWFLHPCRTAAVMAQLATLAAWSHTHYLASWLSWAAPMVGLTIDVSSAFL